MPRSKKQKTNHHPHQPYSTRDHQQTANDKVAVLSHEEIWDDSALLRSWDDAVKEYEFYHSIHARGEDVDEVLRQAGLAEQQAQTQAQAPAQQTTQNTSLNPMHQPDDQNLPPPDRNTSSDEEEGEIDETNIPTLPLSSRPTNPAAQLPPLDPTMTSKVSSYEKSASIPIATADDSNVNTSVNGSDQTLENLKMAYYWAGYYSGLYDGQRQGQKGEQGG